MTHARAWVLDDIYKNPQKTPESIPQILEYIALHDHTARLLQLAHDLGQQSIDNLFDLVLLLRLLVLLLLVMSLLLARVATLVWCVVGRIVGHDSLATSEVNVNTAGVVFGSILQAEFTADLFDARFDLLDMAGGVVSLADDTRGL